MVIYANSTAIMLSITRRRLYYMRKFILLAASLTLLTSASAKADILAFSYTGIANPTISGSGEFVTDNSNPANILPGQGGGTETYMGVTETITGLSNYGSADNQTTFPNRLLKNSGAFANVA
jgi:hypothetical protein